MAPGTNFLEAIIEEILCIFGKFSSAKALDGGGRGTYCMRCLIKVAFSSLRRSITSRFAGNLICNDSDDFLVQNYILRVLRPLDPYEMHTRAAFDFSLPDRGPQKLESQQFFALNR